MSYQEQIDLLHPSTKRLEEADYPFISGYQLARTEASYIAASADAELAQLRVRGERLVAALEKAENTLERLSFSEDDETRGGNTLKEIRLALSAASSTVAADGVTTA